MLERSTRDNGHEPAAGDRRSTVRVALVTGGTGGIGTEICKNLAELGNQVIATYLGSEETQATDWQRARRSEGYDIHLVECDVSNFDACVRMAETVESRYESVDILINCAGITRDKTLGKMEKDHWHAVLDTNLDSVFNITRNVIDGMIRRGYGRIVNISSVNGQKGQFGQTNYAAAKAGMHGFTKSLAREVASCGITVNTVSPGYVDTHLLKAIPDPIRQDIVSKIPMGRLATPEEIAWVVAFLASEESTYITGSNIAVNGGLFMV
ncbi:MAG: acetoacetyl-CoA reductase [Gammaproteobacteria bacterium]